MEYKQTKKWHLWNISISILVFLTVYNVFLTIKLMYSSSCAQNSPQLSNSNSQPLKKFQQECQNTDVVKSDKKLENNFENHLGSFQTAQKYFSGLNLALGRLDNRLMYRFFDNILVGEQYVPLSEVYETCLATQSSLDKIASLVEVSLYWGGPISLALFAINERELNRLLMYILYLRKCNLRIREKVTFHLAIPREKGPKNIFIDEERMEKMECENPVGVLNGLLKEINKGTHSWRTKPAYPQNHLRNLARKNCHTKYVFLTDVDIIPSKGMAELLNTFLEKQNCKAKKCAYVVPTYELDERVLYPPNKTDLIRLANKGLARPFHHKVFIYNQYATNFSRWQSYKDEGEKIRISHPVTNFEFLYEPFYIAPDNVPPHDERFVGYGYTRNSQVYEMFVAGYEFFVLSPIFTCHWGLQVKRTRPPWREHQNNINRKQFDNFKREIFARYNKDPLNMMAPR